MKVRNYSKLFLTTQNGNIIITNGKVTNTYKISNDTGGIMGITYDNNFLYVSSLNQIIKLDRNFNRVLTSEQMNVDYHDMNKYGSLIYVSATKLNEIHIFNEHLKLKQRIKITPPNENKSIKQKENYNHLNSVIKWGNKFYVNLNWYDAQYGMSGVAEFDTNWNEIRRFKMGWESHDLQIYNNQFIIICATSNTDKQINHPKKSGIMIDNALVFEYDCKESFCKGLTWDNNYLYLCGGNKLQRHERKNGKGIIYIIDRNNFKLVEKITDLNISNIKGCEIYEDFSNR